MTYSLCGDSAQMGESRSLRSQIIVTVWLVNQHLLESVDSYYELASTVLFFHLTSLFAAYIPKLNNSVGGDDIYMNFIQIMFYKWSSLWKRAMKNIQVRTVSY